MKCPVCEGKGNRKRPVESGSYTDFETGEQTYFVKCPHCNGTGGIPEGSYWMVGPLYPAVLVWSNGKFRQFPGGPPLGRIDGKEWVPIYRMEKVE